MHKLFSRNYLYIGEPVYLDKFYGTKSASDYMEATEIIHQAMLKIREDLNAYVEEHNPRLAKKHKKELAKQKAKEEAAALKEQDKINGEKSDALLSEPSDGAAASVVSCEVSDKSSDGVKCETAEGDKAEN